jgi:hypothetical protein
VTIVTSPGTNGRLSLGALKPKVQELRRRLTTQVFAQAANCHLDDPFRQPRHSLGVLTSTDPTGDKRAIAPQRSLEVFAQLLRGNVACHGVGW